MYVHVTHKVGRESQSKEHYTDEQDLNSPSNLNFLCISHGSQVYHIRSTMVLAWQDES